MSAISEGSVVAICVEVKVVLGVVKDATGTIFFISKDRLGVLLPCGTLWYGTPNQLYSPQ